MADSKKQPLKKLGKLSVAILEHHVDKVIGEDAIEILKADYKENQALIAALENAEQRFRDDIDDVEMYRVFFVDLAIKDLPSLNEAYKAFYARPTSPDLPRVLLDAFVPYVQDEQRERWNQAIAKYILFLKQELAQVDETFRDNAHAIAGIRSEQLLEDIRNELRKQSAASLLKDKHSQKEKNAQVQVFLEGIDEVEFDGQKQQALITTVAALTSISPEQVKIMSVRSGSLIVVLLMPFYAAEKLVQFVQGKDKRLRSINVSEAEIIGENDQSTPQELSNLKEIPEPGALPSGSRMVFLRNQVFTGRKKDLKALAKSVFEDQTPTLVTQTITGIGGIGKTQLAVEFCYRYGRYFQGVHWIDAAAVSVEKGKPSVPLLSKIEAEIAQCGVTMLLPDWPQEQPEQVRRTLAHWAQSGPRLVILDNLEDVQAAQEIITLLSSGGDLRILITARRQEWPKALVGKPYQLSVFTKTESRALLREYLSDRNLYPQAQLDELAKHLGHLPLALELAGRYIKRTRRDVPTYLESLEEIMGHPSMDNWRPEAGANPTEHDRSLHRTFLVSWLLVEDEAVERLFRLMSWCAANEPIPQQLLLEAAELEEDKLAEALIELEDVGLITYPRAGSEPVLHPLVAEFGRVESRAAAELTDLEKIADSMVGLSSSILNAGMPKAFEPIRSHIETLASHTGTAELGLAGILWNNLGGHLNMVAGYRGAQTMYERALAISERHLGEDNPRVATTINNLGMVLQDLGDLEGAQAMLERALAIDEAALGPEHSNVARDVNNLGLVRKDLGDLEGAQIMLGRALAIWQQHLGDGHPKVAVTFNNLGAVLQALGDLNGAQAMLERALAIDEAALGPEHPAVARDINNLGYVLQDLGDLEGAQDMYERALAIDEATFGLEHPEVARDVNNLGGVRQVLGDLEVALALYQRALAIDEATFGPEHPKVAIRVNNLGSVLQDLGDLEGAQAMYERALVIFEKTLPPDHPTIQIIKDNLDSLGN